jgi:hypothetical protein
MPLVKRPLQYDTTQLIKNLLCCPCNFTCGLICCCLSLEEKTEPMTYYTAQNVQVFDDATSYFCCPDDKLTKRCDIIANEAEKIIFAFKEAQGLGTNALAEILTSSNPAHLLSGLLRELFNVYYFKGDDILSTSSTNLPQIHRLHLLGQILGEKVLEKLPQDFAETAKIAGVNIEDKTAYRVYFNTRLSDTINNEFIKATLPVCYEERQLKLRAEFKEENRQSAVVAAAAQAAHQTSGLYAPPQALASQQSYQNDMHEKALVDVASLPRYS